MLPTDQMSSLDRDFPGSSHAAASIFTIVSPPESHAADRGREVDALRQKIRQLETRLSQATQAPVRPNARVDTPDSHPESTSLVRTNISVHESSPSAGRTSIIRHIMYKTRLFGRSHWMTGAIQFQDNFDVLEPYFREEMVRTASGLRRCKFLAKSIKLQRSPPWPTTPTPDLPDKAVADQLVEGYLRTSETIYRILHIPSFMRDYNAMWVTVPRTVQDPNFRVQAKIVLAIGATVYDEQFSLRQSAVRWVHEAQTWLTEPVFKSRLSIQSLQTELLLLIARERVGVGGELVWISAGSVFRAAVHMGLHRDPTLVSRMSLFTTEMRRRLWNTILEISLQSCMDSGSPPLVNLDDFDTAPPGNFDDDQLITAEDADAPNAPNPVGQFTQTTVVACLRESFPLRLEIAKFLNDIKSPCLYEEAIRLDTKMRASYRALSQTLRGCRPAINNLSPSTVETGVVNLIMCRYLSAIHVPFFGPSLQEAASTYAFSRKVVSETALKVWSTLHPLHSQSSNSAPLLRRYETITTLPEEDLSYLQRLTTCCSGFVRNVAFQASFIVAAELRAQLCEYESCLPRPPPLRQDLVAVLEDAQSLMLRCVEAGETNIKNYLLLSVLSAQIGGLLRGLPRDAFPPLLTQSAEDAITTCLATLEKNATLNRQQETTLDTAALGQISPKPSMDSLEGWDFLFSDLQFDFGLPEPVT
ncbi:hypothetical protein PV04_08934 [Phialophora macrospora]|uniref:Xylanolytic transcriptional activator regulatory domain-containing protein n=1 Tax=Phialophora macrospora TaxID=1851006 RepID=A0A0D2FVD2_9EURO|nr:hypothetical protein PV04_08934 [Phialophora macrospora]